MRELYTRFFEGRRVDWKIFLLFPLFAYPFSLIFLKFPIRNFLDGVSRITRGMDPRKQRVPSRRASGTRVTR